MFLESLESVSRPIVYKQHMCKSVITVYVKEFLDYSCVLWQISEKQFILTALGARAKLKSWFDVDSLFNAKNWLGYTKKRSPIGFHRVVDILQKNSAPVNVLQEYVNLIDDPELKLSVALKYKCHDVVINTYRDLKDRQELAVYREKLERDSPEYRKILELLNNVQIRWKN